MFCSMVLESNECYIHENWYYMNIKRPFSIVYYVIEGSAFFKFGDKLETLQKGHLYVLPSNETYSLYENPNDKMYHAYMHVIIHPKVSRFIDLDITQDEFLSSIIDMLRRYIKTDGNPPLPNVYTQKVAELLISYISEIQHTNHTSIHHEIKKYIDKNYIEIFHDNNLPKVFGYSPSQLNKIFKDAYNVTPKKYCSNLVLNHVVHLLQEGYSSSEITSLLNFSSPANLSRFVKTNYGISPSEINESHSQKKTLPDNRET